MINKEQVIPLLIEACPSAREPLEQYPDRDLLYGAVGEFACHLLQLQTTGQTTSFPAVATTLERLYTEGDAYVRELATIGLLEGIQNVWGNNDVNPELFEPYLLPESRRWWVELNAFWNSERRYVGEGLAKELTSDDVAKIREEICAFNKRTRANEGKESK